MSTYTTEKVRPRDDIEHVADVANKHEAEKFITKKKINAQLAKRLRHVGLQNEAKKLDACQSEEVLYFCESCGEHQYRLQSCRYRHCAFCSVSRGIELRKRVRAIVDEVDRPKLLTLTMPPTTDLGAGVSHIKKAFSNWRRLHSIKSLVHGGCYTIEVVPKAAGWHVHIHAVIQSEYLPVKLLWETWRQVLGLPHANADIRELKGEKGILEAIKYITKGSALIKMTNPQLEMYIRHLTNKRMFGTFGTWYNPDWDALIEPDDYEAPPCPHCNRKETMKPIFMGPFIFKQFWDDFRHHHLKDLPETRTPTWITSDETGELTIFDAANYNADQWLRIKG